MIIFKFVRKVIFDFVVGLICHFVVTVGLVGTESHLRDHMASTESSLALLIGSFIQEDGLWFIVCDADVAAKRIDVTQTNSGVSDYY